MNINVNIDININIKINIDIIPNLFATIYIKYQYISFAQVATISSTTEYLFTI